MWREISSDSLPTGVNILDFRVKSRTDVHNHQLGETINQNVLNLLIPTPTGDGMYIDAKTANKDTRTTCWLLDIQRSGFYRVPPADGR